MDNTTATRRLPGLVLIIMLLTLPSAARAAVYKMECRERRVNGEYLGSYVFSFDPDAKSLSIAYQPEGEIWEQTKLNPLFGAKVKKWNLLWQKELDAVFYGIDDDLTGPVKLLTLKFSVVKMFVYSLGGLVEDKGWVDRTRKECRRLD